MAALREQFCARGLDVAQPERLLALQAFKLEAPLRMGGVEVARRLQVGAYSYLHDGQLHAVSIGRFCSVGRRLVCLQANHPTDWVSTHPFQHMPMDGIIAPAALQAVGWDQHAVTLIAKFKADAKTRQAFDTNIGHDVWIGTDVTIVNGVKVGSGAVIGAGSVVTRDVAPYSVVAGNPAKFIRFRFDEPTCESMLACEWWNFEPADFGDLPFDQPLEFLQRINERKHAGELRPMKPQTSLKNDFLTSPI